MCSPSLPTASCCSTPSSLSSSSTASPSRSGARLSTRSRQSTPPSRSCCRARSRTRRVSSPSASPSPVWWTATSTGPRPASCSPSSTPAPPTTPTHPLALILSTPMTSHCRCSWTISRSSPSRNDLSPMPSARPRWAPVACLSPRWSWPHSLWKIAFPFVDDRLQGPRTVFRGRVQGSDSLGKFWGRLGRSAHTSVRLAEWCVGCRRTNRANGANGRV
mmetsp:Transcript_37541/g.63187  ORF Transcript_37541/g.63187 Transcript_37541/m.63187 type:complete len:218 (+) Transcript_37541:2259-2912(+)